MISVVYLSVLWRYLMSKRKNFAEKANKTLHKQYDFSTTEIWNADHAIVNFSYQILKKYKKSKRHGYPAEFKNPEEWEKVLDRILKAFKRTLNDYADSPMNKAYDIVNIGLHFFHKDVRLMLPLVVKHSIVAA